jgi:lipase chaperone LimK
MKRNEVVGFQPSHRQETQMNYQLQEAPEVKLPKSQSARINPDSIPVLATAVSLVGVLMISSFIVSFSGLYDASEWTGLPEYFRWLPALFIDAAILAYTIALIVFKARGESVWRTVVGLVGFAAISVIANVSHTLAYWDGNLVDYRAWVGVAITASAPIAVLLAAEEIARLAFQKQEK